MNKPIPFPVGLRTQQDKAESLQAEFERIRPKLNFGDGGGTSGGMETRVGKLEAHVENLRDDMKDIRSSLKEINGKLERLEKLPTKSDMVTYWFATFAISLTVFGIAVSAIIGGLDWIKGH